MCEEVEEESQKYGVGVMCVVRVEEKVSRIVLP